jgi:iron complex transport system substrate-binding protein
MQTAPVLSLLPSATEIVCALGAGPHLVGRSHECDYPPWVARLPAVTRARVDSRAPPAALDRAVRELVRQAASIYTVDDALLAQLAPGVIVTQTQCEVCAVSEGEVRRALSAAAGTPVRLVSLSARDLAGVHEDIAAVGAALDREGAAAQLSAALREGFAMLRLATAGRAPARVVCLEWLDPPMTGGHWLPELVRLAGGTELLAEPGGASRYTDWDEIARADPQAVVVLPCGYDLARALAHARQVFGAGPAARLRAARERRVFVADGNQFFNRPGPRLLESAEILAEMFAAADFGHRAAGYWCPLTQATP